MGDIIKSPAVCVLVPIYNADRYLTQCLDSLIHQTMPDMEILCLDDGSTDNSASIISDFARRDPRIRTFSHENHGYGWTVNKGIDEARGDFIGIVESDDWVEPTMFDNLYRAARTTDADMAKCNFYLEWTSSPKRRELFRYFSTDDNGRVICPREDAKGAVFRKKPTVWSAIYRTSFLMENGIRFLETPGACFQDTSFSFKALWCAKKVVCCTTPYVHYRQDNGASSINATDKEYCVCDEYEEIERFLGEFPDSGPFAARVLAPMIYDTFMWNYERLDPSLKQPFLEVASAWFRRLLDEDRVDWTGFTQDKRTNFRVIAYAPTAYSEWKHSTAQRPTRMTLVATMKKWMRSVMPPSRTRFNSKMRALTRQVEALQITVDELVRQNNVLLARSEGESLGPGRTDGK